MTQFEVTVILRAVEALRRIAEELSHIRALLEQKSPEGTVEGKESAK